jgi:L-ribulose-5-phosphate 3-epimerase UlaE
MLVASFVGATGIMIETICLSAHRLDAGHSYIEQVVAEMESVIEERGDAGRESCGT